MRDFSLCSWAAPSPPIHPSHVTDVQSFHSFAYSHTKILILKFVTDPIRLTFHVYDRGRYSVHFSYGL